MNTLITPAEVYDVAFSATEPYDSSVLTALDIATAEERYLRPIVGDELYDALLDGSYPELRNGYVLPMVAAWTRYLVEPLLATRCGVCHGAKPTVAENEAAMERCRLFRKRAQTLARNLAKHLNSSCSAYPEYDPNKNPLNRCSIDGNIVQIY